MIIGSDFSNKRLYTQFSALKFIIIININIIIIIMVVVAVLITNDI